MNLQNLQFKYWLFKDTIRYMVPYRMSNFFYKLDTFLFPRQKWLTKQIPTDWRDKDSLIEILLPAILKHYVEKDGENCFEVINFNDYDDNNNLIGESKFGIELKLHYKIVTEVIPGLQKQLEIEWDSIKEINSGEKDIVGYLNSVTPESYNVRYGKIDDLEKEIYNLQTETFTWIIKNRNRLWT